MFCRRCAGSAVAVSDSDIGFDGHKSRSRCTTCTYLIALFHTLCEPVKAQKNIIAKPQRDNSVHRLYQGRPACAMLLP